MRIVSYLPTLASIGGVERHILETTRELAARGHQICLFYERSGNLTDEFRSFCRLMRPETYPRHSDAPVREVWPILQAVLAAAAAKPDLVYANNFSELTWAVGVRRLTGASIVCHLHEFKPIRQTSLSVLGSRVARFVVGSQFMRARWSDHGLDPERIAVIHEGLAPDHYSPGSEREQRRARELLGLPADAHLVLYMGRLIPEKGIDVLLDAWQLLDADPVSNRMLIVGLPDTPDGYVERLRARAPAGCHWLPMRPDVVGTLHAADVLVLPSRWQEPFGRVVIEAMATGRPAVAAAVGGVPEILDGEFEKMLFPREDASALADRLRALRHWRREDPALGERCADHVARRFSLGAAISALETVFATCDGALA